MELKKGETIMTDASLHMPAAFLHEAFSNRSGVPPSHFELYYRSKRLEGEAALASYGIGKDATIEVKMRGRGGGCVGTKEVSDKADRSAEQHPAGEVDRSTEAPKAVTEKAVEEKAAVERAVTETASKAIIELHGGLAEDLVLAQVCLAHRLVHATAAYPPHH